MEGNAVLTQELQDQLLKRLAETYYKTPGSVTAAMRNVIESLNQYLLDRNLRPALPDHAPRIESRPGLLRINGLFRHGWLIAPALVEDALLRVAVPTAEEAASR